VEKTEPVDRTVRSAKQERKGKRPESLERQKEDFTYLIERGEKEIRTGKERE